MKLSSDIGSFSQPKVYGIGRAKEREESCSLVVPRASAGMCTSEGISTDTNKNKNKHKNTGD